MVLVMATWCNLSPDTLRRLVEEMPVGISEGVDFCQTQKEDTRKEKSRTVSVNFYTTITRTGSSYSTPLPSA